MKRLGELLLERGAVTVDELQTGLDAVMRKGGRLGTHLLEYGFVEEGQLLEALSEQLGVPAVSEETVLGASREAVRLIPRALQERYLAVPIAATADRLDVAMVNPRDPEAREALERAAAPRAVRRFVSTERAIRRAVQAGPAAAPPEPPRREPEREVLPSPEAWEAFWSVPPAPAEALGRLQPAGPAARAVRAVRFPGLEPMSASAVTTLPPTLDRAALLARLAEVRRRDEVAELLVRYLHRYLGRVALFVVHRNRVVGWTGHGEGVIVEDLESLILPLDRPSLFLNLLHTGEYYRGPVPPGEANRVLVEALGKPTPEEVLAVPLRLKGRAVVFALGDNPGLPLGDVPVPEIVSTCERAALAFEILILRSKMLE